MRSGFGDGPNNEVPTLKVSKSSSCSRAWNRKRWLEKRMRREREPPVELIFEPYPRRNLGSLGGRDVEDGGIK